MRFSHSRLAKFLHCAKAWEYSYVEGLREPDSDATLIGGIFHECVEQYYDPDLAEGAEDPIKKWKDAILGGRIERDADLMEYVLKHYLEFYKEEDMKEDILGVELELETELDGEDTIMGKVDRLVEVDGMLGVRDTKTTEKALKYTTKGVRYNPQLYLYAGMYEEIHRVKVDFVEIDEVRVAKLQDPPINKNGKPTADYKRLGLTTYERYLEILEDKGLDTDPAYKGILEKLQERGHPLFRRTRVMLDREILDTVLEDVLGTYRTLNIVRKNDAIPYYRSRGRLCDWCGYQELCNADYFDMDAHSRQAFLDKFEVKKDT